MALRTPTAFQSLTTQFTIWKPTPNGSAGQYEHSLGPASIENIGPGKGTLVESVPQYAFVLMTGQAWSSIQRAFNFWRGVASLLITSSVLASLIGIRGLKDGFKIVAVFNGHLNVRMKCRRGGRPMFKVENKHGSSVDYVFFSVAFISNMDFHFKYGISSLSSNALQPRSPVDI